MSRRTPAANLALDVARALLATDDASLAAARAFADRLSFEIAKLEVLEAPGRPAGLDLVALGIRGLEGEGR